MRRKRATYNISLRLTAGKIAAAVKLCLGEIFQNIRALLTQGEILSWLNHRKRGGESRTILRLEPNGEATRQRMPAYRNVTIAWKGCLIRDGNGDCKEEKRAFSRAGKENGQSSATGALHLVRPDSDLEKPKDIRERTKGKRNL